MMEGAETFAYVFGPPLGGFMFTHGGPWAPSIVVGLLLLLSLVVSITVEKAVPSSPAKQVEQCDEEEGFGSAFCRFYSQHYVTLAAYARSQTAVSYLGPNIAAHLGFYTEGHVVLAGVVAALPAIAFLGTAAMLGGVVGTSRLALIP